jgi:hypothetical protein
MILGRNLGEPPSSQAMSGGRATLDELFGRAVTRRPDAIALSDPPNRGSFTDGAPRSITYAQADLIVTAIAARLRTLGLATDAVVAVQLPNTIESALTILGILRAGMIAAPLPLLWRKADCVVALSRIGARAIVTTSRVNGFDHSDLAMHVAADIFPVRYICGFGKTLADGVIPFDDLMFGGAPDALEPVTREFNPAAHTAIVTWDTTPAGLIAVARNHNELIAAGLGVMLEGRIAQDCSILSAGALSSLAGLATALMPWLLSGGALSLHQPFDGETFAKQCEETCCDTVVLPGALAHRLLEAGLLSNPELQNVLAVWRTPERFATGNQWRHPLIEVTDIVAFGEVGVVPIRRGTGGMPASIPEGDVTVPRGTIGASRVCETARSDAGTLALRGPMVPQHAFPPGAERGIAPHFKAAFSGFVDTGYPCRIEQAPPAVVITGPVPNMVTVGAYRFVRHELEDLVSKAGSDATLAALPDRYSGHRLAGYVKDKAALQSALAERGINPLVGGAFRDRDQKPV